MVPGYRPIYGHDTKEKKNYINSPVVNMRRHSDAEGNSISNFESWHFSIKYFIGRSQSTVCMGNLADVSDSGNLYFSHKVLHFKIR